MVNARTSGDGRAGESKGANPQSSAASASSNLWMPAGLAQPAPVPSRKRSDHAAINKRVKEQIKKTRQRLYRSNGNWAVAWILHEDLVSQHGKDKALDEWSGSCFSKISMSTANAKHLQRRRHFRHGSPRVAPGTTATQPGEQPGTQARCARSRLHGVRTSARGSSHNTRLLRTGREGPGQWMLKPRFALQLKLLRL
jgi:hypothetical protein